MTAPKAIKRYRRFKGWDYTKGVSLFIAIATAPRRPFFGEIKGGKVVLTPFGEKVAEALRAMPRLNPESCYVEPFAENRYLEIARGNDETEFGRRACLDLNAEIIEIATSGEGLALYWKAAGPRVLAWKAAGPRVLARSNA